MVIDVYTSKSCRYCPPAKKAVQEYASANGIECNIIDVDEPGVSIDPTVTRYIRSVPTTVVYNGGQVVKFLTGIPSAKDLAVV